MLAPPRSPRRTSWNRGLLVEPSWNPGGTLVEPSWNLTSGPPRTTPEPIWAETPKLSAVGEEGDEYGEDCIVDCNKAEPNLAWQVRGWVLRAKHQSQCIYGPRLLILRLFFSNILVAFVETSFTELMISSETASFELNLRNSASFAPLPSMKRVAQPRVPAPGRPYAPEEA